MKTTETPRLIRILFNGEYIVETTEAILVWEHPYYPQYYIPARAFRKSKAANFTATKGAPILQGLGGEVIAYHYTLRVKDRETDECIYFDPEPEGPAALLAGYVKINFNAVDRWFEEAMPIFVHPKDPFKRVDVVPSTRRIQIYIGGQKVADSTSSMHLYETGLPSRFYLPLTDVDASVLRPSKTRTQCPYKGEAEYYSVETSEGGEVAKDVVWYYERPTLECAKIEGELRQSMVKPTMR